MYSFEPEEAKAFPRYLVTCDLVVVRGERFQIYEVQSADYQKHTAVIAERFATPKNERTVSMDDLELFIDEPYADSWMRRPSEEGL